MNFLESFLNFQKSSDDIAEYLKEKQKEGYKVIAAEQSTKSCNLNDYRFPDNCVLLMGNERRGVPPALLNLVDETVEIPQIGATKSLNVHVSASLMIYQFAIQKFFVQKTKLNETSLISVEALQTIETENKTNEVFLNEEMIPTNISIPNDYYKAMALKIINSKQN